jgi:transposase
LHSRSQQAESGTQIAEVCRKMGISEATFYRWKQLYGGLMPSEVKKLRQLELRIPGAAAQTRVVSMARIRLGSWESVRPFKGIICDDISEFESYMPRQAVRSLCARRG